MKVLGGRVGEGNQACVEMHIGEGERRTVVQVGTSEMCNIRSVVVRSSKSRFCLGLQHDARRPPLGGTTWYVGTALVASLAS